MLGFALSEAHRSQELMKRLHEQKGHPLLSSDASINTNGIGHKRTRRRRRTKKLPAVGPSGGGGGSRGSTGSLHRSGGQTPKNPYSASNRTSKHDAPMTKRDLYFSLRCGMVSTGPGGRDSEVGRVTLVNWDEQIVLDAFVKVPPERVFDYRTESTGITAELLAMNSALRFDTARTKVGNLIRGKILVGHCLEVDLNALGLGHPLCDVRDTATYVPYMKPVDGHHSMLLPRPLEELMYNTYGHGLNTDQPTLVREATACLALYKHARAEWERELVHTAQQKERQREMMLNMRASNLSSIYEDSVVPLPDVVSGVAGSVTSSGHHLRYVDDYDYEDSYHEDSTIATDTYGASTITTEITGTEPTTASEDLPYTYDDQSEASDFFSHDTDAESFNTFLALRQDVPESTPSHIENISDLKELQRSGSHKAPFTFPGSSTAPGSVSRGASSEDPSHSSRRSYVTGHNGEAQGMVEEIATGSMWPVMSLSTQNSVASADWSHGSSARYNGGSSAASRPDGEKTEVISRDQHFHPFPGAAAHFSLTEEEVREHLPSHLLADLDDDATGRFTREGSDRSQNSQQKKGWFARGERRRSMPSGSSSGFFHRHDSSKAGVLVSAPGKTPARNLRAPPGFG